MKLLPTIADAATSLARKSPDPGNGGATTRDRQPQFSDILSDCEASPTTPASKVTSCAAPSLGGAAKLATVAVDMTVQPAGGRPSPPDVPTASASLPHASHAIDSRKLPDDEAAEGDDRRAGEDDGPPRQAKLDDQPVPQPANALLLVAPSSDPRPVPAKGPSIAPHASSVAAPPQVSIDMSSPAPQAADRSGAAPTIFDIAVLSQPAPAASQTAGLASIGVADMAASLEGAAGPKGGTAGAGTSASPRELEPAVTDGASATGSARIADVASAATDRDDSAADGSASDPSDHPVRDAAADRAAPKGATPLDVGPTATSPAGPTNAVATLSPSVRHVADALARLGADVAPPAQANAAEAVKARPTIARTLTLQLSPADRGTVAIKMHSTAGSLDVQVTATDPRTAGLLSRERDALAATLQDGRTALHSLVIQDGSGTSQPGGHHATRGDTSGGDTAGGTTRDHQAGDGTGADGGGSRRREQSDGRLQRGAEGGRRGEDRAIAAGDQAGGGGRSFLV